MIKKTLYALFPFLKLQENNLSLFKKTYIIFDGVTLLLAYIIILLFFFSHLFYTYKVENKHIKLYTNENLLHDKQFQKTMKNIKNDLSKNDLYFKNYHVKIHLVDNKLLYDLNSLFQSYRGNVAVNLFDNIFIDNNFIVESKNKDKELYTEIVHETIHTFQAKRYGGWMKFRFNIPYWVFEGYPTYVSKQSNINKNTKKFLISCQDKNFKSLLLADTYILNGLLVKYSIKKMHKTVDELHKGKVDYDEVLNSLLKEYNITKEKK